MRKTEGTKRPVKKVVRKVARKTGTVSKRGTVKTVSTQQVTEVFSTRGVEFTTEVTSGRVLLFVNGDNKGEVSYLNDDGKALTVSEFAIRQATRQGIRSFSIYADGIKLDTSNANTSMSRFLKLEMVSKDTRG